MSQKGQTMLEYFLLIGIIMLALMYMGTDLKRGLQSVIKVTADQIGNQANADQDYNGQQGYLVNSWSGMAQQQQRTLRDRNGTVAMETVDVTYSGVNSLTNQGLINN